MGLEDYFDAVTTGPGIWKWRHYFPIYEHHFAKFRNQSARILEIGILGGGSLGMWEDYFGSAASIYGVDIDPRCARHANAQTQVFIGDQADRTFWADFIQQVPGLDVVIDDGGHTRECCVTTFEALLPILNPGGVYLCEDLYVSEQANPRRGFQEYLNNLMTGMHDCPSHSFDANYWQRRINSITIYPFAAVAEMRDEPLQRLEAPMHGDEWA